MLVAGIGTKTLKHEIVPNLNCETCGDSCPIHVKVYGDFVHFFWLPTFPIHKSAQIYCPNCDYKLAYSKIRKDPDFEDVNYLIKKLKKESSHPWTSYIGLPIYLALIAIIILEIKSMK